MEQSYRPGGSVLSRVTQWLVLIYQTIAIVVFVASIFLGLNWINRPFIGGFFEQTLVLNGINTTQPGAPWGLYAEGFKLGDQLKAIEGEPIASTNELEAVLLAHRVDDTIQVTIVRGGQEITVSVTLEAWRA